MQVSKVFNRFEFISAMSETSHEVIARIIARLAREGLIATGRKQIDILDFPALQQSLLPD